MVIPPKNILVPVDFSPSSRLALIHARSLAQRFGAKVQVVHAWDVPPYLRPDLTVWANEVSATLEDHCRREAERCMGEFLAEVQAGALADVTSRVVFGPATDTILDIAERGGVDLIAMGTHGRTGFSHVMLGSVAERIVRRAKCPVLTVRDTAGAEATPPADVQTGVKRVVVGTDFGESSAEALAFAIVVAERYDAGITLVHAQEIFPGAYPDLSRGATDPLAPLRDMARKELDEAVAALRATFPNSHGSLRFGVAWKEILRIAELERADLIVVGTHGRRGITHALLGSVAEKVLRLSPTPVLTVPAKMGLPV